MYPTTKGKEKGEQRAFSHLEQGTKTKAERGVIGSSDWCYGFADKGQLEHVRQVVTKISG